MVSANCKESTTTTTTAIRARSHCPQTTPRPYTNIQIMLFSTKIYELLDFFIMVSAYCKESPIENQQQQYEHIMSIVPKLHTDPTTCAPLSL